MDEPRAKLSELIGRFGPGLSQDARRCKALLADVCGNQFRRECAVLVAAVEEGVAGELLSNSSGLPVEVLLGRLSDRLHAHRGVSTDLARWGVECWAVALGVTASGSELTKFRMEGMAPLIELAGADGLITDAELNHLIQEAKTRGVSETDARTYLTTYAASRGWQFDKARRRRAAPQAPPPPVQPQPQPGQPLPSPKPASDRAFRWVALGVAALAAIAITVLVMKQQPQPQPSAHAPVTPSPTPPPDTAQQQRQEQADREQRTYNAARGNLTALRAYVNSCSICAYAPAARSEIARLETAEQEERTYNAARGNKYALQAYVNTCTICTYAPAARAEINSIEAAEPKRVSSSAVICGQSVDFVVDGTGISDMYRPFLGLWTGAAWNSRICGGLIVRHVDSDGTAWITYIYGPLPGAQFPWKSQTPIALIKSNQLAFQDEERGNFSFRLTGQNVLQGHFVSANGVILDATLTRDMSSVP